jgi:hypothetical protein
MAMRTVELYASVALLALSTSTTARAQSSTPGDQPALAPAQGARTTSYDAAFFAKYVHNIKLRCDGNSIRYANCNL